MLHAMVTSELRSYLLDRRFIGALIVGATLSAVSIVAGIHAYTWERTERDLHMALRLEAIGVWTERECLPCLRDAGTGWVRPPEVLRPMVGGLSDALGQQVAIRRQPMQYYIHHQPHFQESHFEQHPAQILFGSLDLCLVVTVVFSLMVLLLTHDAVCGEKESGTLRLCASFPVSRATLALAKLTGVSLAVLLPLGLGCLAGSGMMALSLDMTLSAEDWTRAALILLSFGLYLAAWAAFGLWISASCHRRLTAFLSALMLWAVWVLLVPNLTTWAARRLSPARSVYELDRMDEVDRWEIAQAAFMEREDYFSRAITDSTRKANPGWWWDHRFDEANLRVDDVWRKDQASRSDARHLARLARLTEQFRLAALLGLASPLCSIQHLTMDLARTGWHRQARIEAAYRRYHAYYTDYIWQKETASLLQPGSDPRGIVDFALFEPPGDEPVAAPLSRNLAQIIGLFLLVAIGYCGAFVSLLRYDVR